eukprot:9984957-Karenia_brevis.AAC.1
MQTSCSLSGVWSSLTRGFGSAQIIAGRSGYESGPSFEARRFEAAKKVALEIQAPILSTAHRKKK